MRISQTGMNWDNITKKLKVGVAIADRQSSTKSLRRFNSNIEKMAYMGAKSTGQLGRLGDGDLVASLQSGSIIPDELFGWSTKTVLALLLALMLFKVKKLQGTK